MFSVNRAGGTALSGAAHANWRRDGRAPVVRSLDLNEVGVSIGSGLWSLQLGGARDFAGLIVSRLRFLATTFFDDFPTIGTATERVQVTSCVKALFRLSG